MSNISADQIRYVVGVSWPRSGHHLLARLLVEYFGAPFKYCVFYREGMDCCRQSPCVRPGIKFAKNHDFDMAVKKLPQYPYLVQYRRYMPSAVSDFELYVMAGNEDSAPSFRRFARIKTKYYMKFMGKWKHSDDNIEKKLVEYDDLISNPKRELEKVVRFFAPTVDVDQEKLAATVANTHGEQTEFGEHKILRHSGVRSARKVEQFRYYDPVYFKEIEDMIKDYQ